MQTQTRRERVTRRYRDPLARQARLRVIRMSSLRRGFSLFSDKWVGLLDKAHVDRR